MKAAFFHDHKFRRAVSGNHFSSGGLPYSVLKSYLAHFDSLVVVGRELDLDGRDEDTRLSVASGDGVELRCVPASTSRLELLVGDRVRTHVRQAIQSVDCAIARLPSLLGLVACHEAIRAGKPYLVEVVACAWDGHWNHGSSAGKPAAPILFGLNRWYISRAPYALYVSERFLQRRYPCRNETQACSDVQVETPHADVLARRLARYACNQAHQFTIGMVASLAVDYKGHETALRALARLKAARHQVKLRCLGAGDATKWMRLAGELGVADRVEFCGTRPSGAPVLEWLDGLDMYIMPSLQEGLPRALVEAMSRALPAIGARTGGIPELLDAKWIHRPKSDEQLAALIGEMITTPRHMSDAARVNFGTAARFDRQILDERRRAFVGAFRDYAATRTARS